MSSRNFALNANMAGIVRDRSIRHIAKMEMVFKDIDKAALTGCSNIYAILSNLDKKVLTNLGYKLRDPDSEGYISICW